MYKTVVIQNWSVSNGHFGRLEKDVCIIKPVTPGYSTTYTIGKKILHTVKKIAHIQLFELNKNVVVFQEDKYIACSK